MNKLHAVSGFKKLTNIIQIFNLYKKKLYKIFIFFIIIFFIKNFFYDMFL